MGAPSTARLDAELVRRGLARSRRRAAELVAEGRVVVAGRPARKPSHPVPPGTELAVDGPPDYVSRGAHKLLGVLDDLTSVPGAPDPDGRWCVDLGASTGGFTQVLLERGARHVLAVDVGHDQLVPALRADPRVTVREGVNVRDLDTLPQPAELVVADLSFISLRLVAPHVLALCAPDADLLLLVKPQFEVGRAALGAGGVVGSPALRAEAVAAVADAVLDAGGRVRAAAPSRLPGPAGNVEYFLWVTPAGDGPPVDPAALAARAVAGEVVLAGADGLRAVVP